MLNEFVFPWVNLVRFGSSSIRIISDMPGCCSVRFGSGSVLGGSWRSGLNRFGSCSVRFVIGSVRDRFELSRGNKALKCPLKACKTKKIVAAGEGKDKEAGQAS